MLLLIDTSGAQLTVIATGPELLLAVFASPSEVTVAVLARDGQPSVYDLTVMIPPEPLLRV